MILASFDYHGNININYLPRINHQIAYSNIYIYATTCHAAWNTNTHGAARLAANSNRVLDVGYLDGL